MRHFAVYLKQDNGQTVAPFGVMSTSEIALYSAHVSFNTAGKQPFEKVHIQDFWKGQQATVNMEEISLLTHFIGLCRLFHRHLNHSIEFESFHAQALNELSTVNIKEGDIFPEKLSSSDTCEVFFTER